MPKRKTKPALSPRKSSKRNPWSEAYERMKAALPTDLSPREYEAACQRIARELGI